MVDGRRKTLAPKDCAEYGYTSARKRSSRAEVEVERKNFVVDGDGCPPSSRSSSHRP